MNLQTNTYPQQIYKLQNQSKDCEIRPQPTPILLRSRHQIKPKFVVYEVKTVIFFRYVC